MIAEIGNLSLLLAISLAFVGMVTGATNQSARKATNIWLIIFALILNAFLCLIFCFAVSDFSVLSVLNHSCLNKPLLYKITAAWGHHEGSMLLWLSAIAIFSVLFALFNANEDNKKFIHNALTWQMLIFFLFGIFTYLSSNPFKRVSPAPEDGFGLNPILQDIGLAMHPPMLYLGYVGFSLAFSCTLAALIEGKFDKKLVKITYPWVILSWSFLTIGIGLGSWWAYRELGWGGYWFWDPVENSSLMPWLTGTALIHSLIAMKKTGTLKIWVITNSIMAFSLSMIGTFIVRSGIITSVHSFASDPERGVFILIILGSLIATSLILLALKGTAVARENNTFALFSLDSFIYLNNILFTTATFTVILGTLYPIVLDFFTGRKISVGAPYFNQIMTPLAGSALLLLIISNHLKWGQNKPNRKKLGLSLCSLALSMVITAYLCEFKFSFLYVLAFLSNWLIIDLIFKSISSKTAISPQMLVAHIGFALLVTGISLNSLLQTETEKVIKIGEHFELSGFKVKLEKIFLRHESNYISRTAKFEIVKDNRYIYLYPETRFYPTEKQQTTESAISYNRFYDFYLTIGEVTRDGSITVIGYYRPYISCIWLSCIFIFLSGFYSFVRAFKLP